MYTFQFDVMRDVAHALRVTLMMMMYEDDDGDDDIDDIDGDSIVMTTMNRRR